jgi:hypothetical protein
MASQRFGEGQPEFDNYLSSQAEALGTDSVLLGARLVGRWKSGAPIELTPMQDDTTMGPDPQRNNNFDFSDDQGGGAQVTETATNGFFREGRSSHVAAAFKPAVGQ